MKRGRHEVDEEVEDFIQQPSESRLLLNELMSVNRRSVMASETDKTSIDQQLTSVLGRMADCVFVGNDDGELDFAVNQDHVRTVADLLQQGATKELRSNAARALHAMLGDDTVVGHGVLTFLMGALDSRPLEDHRVEFIQAIVEIITGTLLAPVETVAQPPKETLIRFVTFATTHIGAKGTPVAVLSLCGDLLFNVIFSLRSEGDTTITDVILEKHLEKILGALARLQQPTCPYALLEGKSNESVDAMDFVGSLFDSLCLLVKNAPFVEQFVKLEGVELLKLLTTKKSAHLVAVGGYLVGQVIRVILHGSECSCKAFDTRVQKLGVLTAVLSSFEEQTSEVQKRVVLAAANLQKNNFCGAYFCTVTELSLRLSLVKWVVRLMKKKSASLEGEECDGVRALLSAGFAALTETQRRTEVAMWPFGLYAEFLTLK